MRADSAAWPWRVVGTDIEACGCTFIATILVPWCRKTPPSACSLAFFLLASPSRGLASLMAMSCRAGTVAPGWVAARWWPARCHAYTKSGSCSLSTLVRTSPAWTAKAPASAVVMKRTPSACSSATRHGSLCILLSLFWNLLDLLRTNMAQ